MVLKVGISIASLEITLKSLTYQLLMGFFIWRDNGKKFIENLHKEATQRDFQNLW